MSYQKKDCRGPARQFFFWYDNDKDLKVFFLVTRRVLSILMFCERFYLCIINGHWQSIGFWSDWHGTYSSTSGGCRMLYCSAICSDGTWLLGPLSNPVDLIRVLSDCIFDGFIKMKNRIIPYCSYLERSFIFINYVVPVSLKIVDLLLELAFSIFLNSIF